MKTLLHVQNLTKKGEEPFELSGITFSQAKLEKVAIAGETGAGKSTLLKLIAGLLQPDDGQLFFEGNKVIGPNEQLVPGHPGIAYLSQHFDLQKSLRVEQVLAYANTLTDRMAQRLFSVCQIDHLLGRRTDQLSGGEKQRVAVCRLLISSPRLLLLDEPFSHLDMAHKTTLKEVIRDIGDKLHITCMLVSHDPLDTLSWADKILVMKDGRMIQYDSPETIYRRPLDIYAGGLFGKYILIDPKRARSFAKLTSVKAFRKNHPGKMMLLRPEHFKVSRKNERAVRAKVERIIFYGSYSDVEARISDDLITVRVNATHLGEGDIVYLLMVGKGACPV